MSKARSPREVCSTTIGISGLIGSLPCWLGSTTSARPGAILLGRPDALTRRVLLARAPRPPRPRSASPRRRRGRAPCASGCSRARGRRRPRRRTRRSSSSVLAGRRRSSPRMLLVGDLDPELVGDRLEHELARDRLRRLGAEPLLERLGRAVPVSWKYVVDVDPARGERADEAVDELARPRLDDEPAGPRRRSRARARPPRRRGSGSSISSSSCSRMRPSMSARSSSSVVELRGGAREPRRRAARAPSRGPPSP